MQIESNGNATITNGRGAPYGGLFQVSTGIKGWNDPRINTETAMKQIAYRTNLFKKSFGREPSAGELYLMQQQGEGGAMALLNPKNANRPAEQVLAEVSEWKRRYGGDPNKVLNHVIKANGGRAGMTAAEFASQWVNKANSVYAGSSNQSQNVASNSSKALPERNKQSKQAANYSSNENSALGTGRHRDKILSVLDKELADEFGAIKELNLQLQDKKLSESAKNEVRQKLQSRVENIKAISKERQRI